MLKPRSYFVKRWLWAYISVHPHVSLGHLLDRERYPADDVTIAVHDLTAAGYLERKWRTGAGSYYVYDVAEPKLIIEQV